MAFWRFDKNGAVLNYDAWIPNLNNWTALESGVDTANVVAAQLPTIKGLCGTIQERCVGPNTQYDSLATCVSTLSKKPYGNLDEAWGDNVVCRSIHVILTTIRPEVSLIIPCQFVSTVQYFFGAIANPSLIGALYACRANRRWKMYSHRLQRCLLFQRPSLVRRCDEDFHVSLGRS